MATDREARSAATAPFWGQSRLETSVPWSRWQRFRAWMRRETLPPRTLADVMGERNGAIRQAIEWGFYQKDGSNV